MRVKLYTDYADGRKVCYTANMKKSATESNVEFDYYVKIKRDSTIAKMIAVVIDNDGKVICKDFVKNVGVTKSQPSILLFRNYYLRC